MENKLQLGTTRNGHKVYVDLEHSHAITHFEKTPALLEAVKEIILTLTLKEGVVDIEKDLGRIVGLSDLVETAPGDDIVYAKRPRRVQYSRFVKNKQATPTSWITLRLLREKDHTYSLYTAFVGRQAPSFPGGNFMPEQSREFWSHHALVWGNQDIIPGTETTECPW